VINFIISIEGAIFDPNPPLFNYVEFDQAKTPTIWEDAKKI
jgi:hypothetical protein